MRTSNNTPQATGSTPHWAHEQSPPPGIDSATAPNRLEPRLARPAQGGNGHHTEQSLRMYTEEQVAEMLQVSLSQLRKWRMKQHEGLRQGPPFRKIGRLVRYPEAALRTYINSEQTDPAL
jgi:predicted DNA-binding transcriptional regulator AlpA